VGPVEVVVDGGRIEGTASTVLDVTGPTWRVLRDGPVSLDRLRAAAERPLPT
jgi:tRNA A37 threonylcarbamoyladenosine synthetase subunit TsaC/SUA5/YrdC